MRTENDSHRFIRVNVIVQMGTLILSCMLLPFYMVIAYRNVGLTKAIDIVYIYIYILYLCIYVFDSLDISFLFFLKCRNNFLLKISFLRLTFTWRVFFCFFPFLLFFFLSLLLSFSCFFSRGFVLEYRNISFNDST